MYLTKEEERIYDGEQGWAMQTCMKILAKLGDLFDASKLVPIESAHVSGVSYKTLGDAPEEFLEALSSDGAKTRVRTTLNPQSFDPEYMRKKLPANIVEKQLSILGHFDRMGIEKSLTCTPYYLQKTSKSSDLAWAESSAVVYANSVLGAYTNREGGPSALAAAMIGKTPCYGIHTSEYRQPKVLVEVETQLKNEMEFGALGIYLGKILENKIPLIRGLKEASESSLKQLSAALAASGMTEMFHLGDDSSEAKGLEKIQVGKKEVSVTVEGLSKASGKSDLVFVGCPHCSVTEISRIAGLLRGKKVCSGVECWVCTSRYVREKAAADVKVIEDSGAHVLVDMCTVVSWTEMLGIKSIMTNSAKTAYYVPSMNKAEATLAPLEQCLDIATAK